MFSLTPFLRLEAPNRLAKAVLRLQKQFKKIVAFGVFDPDTGNGIPQLFKAIVIIEEENEIFRCKLKSVGKTLKTFRQTFTLDGLRIDEDEIKAKEDVFEADVETGKIPLTTFQVTLSEEEKQAREKVALPFWKKRQEEFDDEGSVKITKAEDKASKIYYEPDDADDWDEEDPDDDLDF